MMDPNQWRTESSQLVSPRTPAEYLKQEMANRSLSAASLSVLLGVHAQTIYNVTGKEPRRISSRLAVALARHFGQDVDFWLKETLSTAPPDRPAARSVRQPSPIAAADETVPLRAGRPVLQSGPMVDWQLAQALSDPDSGLTIRSPDEIHIRSASIDLTIGMIVVRGYEYLRRDILTLIARYRLAPENLGPGERDNAEAMIEFYSKELDFRDSYALAPGESVIIVSREHLAFGDKFVGRVGQNTSLLLEGCQVIHGLQVDPGFSGPLFVRAVNVLQHDSVGLAARDVLLSMEIVSLPEPPDHAHQGGVDRRVAHVTAAMREAIGELFTYRSKPDDVPYKATFNGAFDKSFVRRNDKDVRGMAIAWIVTTLADASSVARPEVEARVREAMDSIAVIQEEAEALMISAAVPQENFDQVLRHFDEGGAQSLLDTILRMGRRPADIVIALLAQDSGR